MPWTGESFASSHNHKLTGSAASKAASMATAMVREGVPEGIAIATANKHGDKMLREHHAAGGIGGPAPFHMPKPPHMTIPKGPTVGGFSDTAMKIAKPEGISASPWFEKREARGAMGGFADGGGIGASHLQMGGMGGNWPAEQETNNELSMPHGGFLNSSIAGRTDRLPVAVGTDAFVVPAQEVAGLGQGNSLAGARMMQEALRIGPHGVPRPQEIHGRGPPSHEPPAIPGQERSELSGFAKGGHTDDRGIAHCLVAGGELIIPRHDWTDGVNDYRGVESVGEGDIKEGHRLLREMVHHIRNHTIEFLESAPEPKK
jgi:hypothetical protein